MNCPNCMQPLDASWTFCDSCGSPVDDRQATTTVIGAEPEVTAPPGMGPAAAASSPVPAARLGADPADPRWPGSHSGAGRPVVPASSVPSAVPDPSRLPGSPILLGYQERLLRQYAAVQLRSRAKGEGTLYVTDSRIVFYAQAKGRGTQRGSTLMQQTNVADITGLTAYISRRISLGLVFLACLFFLFALGSLAVSPPFALLWFLLMLICIAFLAGGAARHGSTGVIINSRADGHSPIAFGTFETRRGWIGSLAHSLGGPFLAVFGVYTVFDVLVGSPGEHSTQIINELGALVLDLQTRGDLAFEHYRADPGQQQSARA